MNPSHEGAAGLSILIPAFNYPEGVARILTALSSASPDHVEIIVSDDSTNDLVWRVVERHRSLIPFVRYIRSASSKGPCANWNYLLDAATREYCLLVHHDEFPLSHQFIRKVRTELAGASHPDVLLLGCLLGFEDGRNRINSPRWLRELIVRHAPSYLFSRNIVGPASVVVARRTMYPRFDANLRWLIDVDAYYRLLKMAGTVCLSKDLWMVSVQGRTDSISAGLKGALRTIRREELGYLRRRYPTDLVIAGLSKANLGSLAVRVGERAAWNVFQVLRLCALLVTPFPVRRVTMAMLLRSGPLEKH